MQPAASRTRRPLVSNMKSAERARELLARSGVEPPLPARYEAVDGGGFKLRVQEAGPLTQNWRANVGAAEHGTVPQVVHIQPDPPLAYKLPKTVLQRQPEEELGSEVIAPT